MDTPDKNIHLHISNSGEHVFSVEKGNIIEWTDPKGKLHTVKSKKDLDSAMTAFINWVHKLGEVTKH